MVGHRRWQEVKARRDMMEEYHEYLHVGDKDTWVCKGSLNRCHPSIRGNVMRLTDIALTFAVRVYGEAPPAPSTAAMDARDERPERDDDYGAGINDEN